MNSVMLGGTGKGERFQRANYNSQEAVRALGAPWASQPAIVTKKAEQYQDSLLLPVRVTLTGRDLRWAVRRRKGGVARAGTGGGASTAGRG